MSTKSTGKSGDTVVVTGSSTGLGLEIALHLSQQGFNVYATIRDLASEPDVLQAAAARGVTLRVLRLDVTDPTSVDEAISSIIAESGGIFGLVNNAGIGLRGALEDQSDAEIRAVFEANVFGTIAVIKRVLPYMRDAGRGRIVTISSVGGRIATFGLSTYCASKFALEGLGEALALEIAPFGLQAILVEPGIINTTRWSTHRGIAAQATSASSPYARMFRRAEDLADQRVERVKTQPLDVAKTVDEALTVDHPRMRYVVGRTAAAVILLRRYLPERVFDRVYFGGLIRRVMSDERPASRVDAAPTAEM